MTDAPLLLITNDDGVHAAGLQTLHRRCSRSVARWSWRPPPSRARPATRSRSTGPCATSSTRPTCTRSTERPADCVYLALFEPRFLPRRPDLVVSGINHGANLGTQRLLLGHRGRCARGRAARHPCDCVLAPGRNRSATVDCATTCATWSAGMLAVQRPAGHAVLLNVNFPSEEPRGVRVTRVGRHVYEERVIPRLDPGGREYFWIGGRVIDYGDVRDRTSRPSTRATSR